MSYQIKRLDPYWVAHPGVALAVAAGAALILIGFKMQSYVLAGIGLAAAGIAVLAATKPVISAVLAVFNTFGGVVTFVVWPKPEMAGLSPIQRVLAAVFFAVFATVLTDAVVLLGAFLYNLLSSTVGLGGVRLDLEESETEEL